MRQEYIPHTIDRSLHGEFTARKTRKVARLPPFVISPHSVAGGKGQKIGRKVRAAKCHNRECSIVGALSKEGLCYRCYLRTLPKEESQCS